MIYLEKYPNAKRGDMVESDIYVGANDNCYSCGKITSFIDVNSGAHFCSEECYEKFYKEYFEASLKYSMRTDFGEDNMF